MKRRVDDIGFGGLKLVQDEDAFCYGTDAVLLANMACRELQITEDMRVCDLGTNTAVRIERAWRVRYLGQKALM